MQINPVPKHLLPHSAILIPITKDDWGGEVDGDPVTVTNVRIEPSRDIVLSKENTEQRLRALLFFDAVNSAPADVKWTEGSKVIHESITYHIASIEPLYALKDTPHHWEIGLI